jgi:MFS family permease
MTGYFAGTYLAMVLGKIVSGYTADMAGRRWVYVFGGLSPAVLLPVIVRLHTPGPGSCAGRRTSAARQAVTIVAARRI